MSDKENKLQDIESFEIAKPSQVVPDNSPQQIKTK
jgi:hypothetical protein